MYMMRLYFRSHYTGKSPKTPLPDNTTHQIKPQKNNETQNQ